MPNDPKLKRPAAGAKLDADVLPPKIGQSGDLVSRNP